MINTKVYLVILEELIEILFKKDSMSLELLPCQKEFLEKLKKGGNKVKWKDLTDRALFI